MQLDREGLVDVFVQDIAGAMDNTVIIEGLTCISEDVDLSDYKIEEGKLIPPSKPGFGWSFIILFNCKVNWHWLNWLMLILFVKINLRLGKYFFNVNVNVYIIYVRTLTVLYWSMEALRLIPIAK